MANIEDLKVDLFTAKDGGDACKALKGLRAGAQEGNERAKEVLALYMGEGRIGHMRVSACAALAQSVKEPNTQFAALFRKGLSDPDLRYWSILGYINAAGKGAYEELIRLAEDARIPTEERAQAVKCLGRISRQPFDRNLPSLPGHWKETDLPLAELRAWAKGGYPDGSGYASPARDPALDKPNSAFEMLVSHLDKKLAKERQGWPDPAGWLGVAAPKDIQRIKERWELPLTYLEFLTRFSPIRVTIESETYYNHLQLFGASELIEAQEGYSFNPIEQQPIQDWPIHLVVIASHGGDPYVLDLSKSDGTDAPVYTAECGAGVWEFRRVADSFSDFINQLAKEVE